MSYSRTVKRGPTIEGGLEELFRVRYDDPKEHEIFDAADLARSLNVHPRTVGRWIAAGKLGGHRVGNRRSRLRIRALDYQVALWAACGRGDRRMANLLMRPSGW